MAKPSPSITRARYALPIAAGGVLLVCAGFLLRGSGETETASAVARRIQEVALAGNEPDAPSGAGMIGPWQIAAEHIDPTSGHFVNFRIQTSNAMISARQAQLHIDSRADSFSFELFDVVLLPLPERRSIDETATMTRFEHYVLGPVPYNVDIVPDAGTDLPPIDMLDPSPLVNVDPGSTSGSD